MYDDLIQLLSPGFLTHTITVDGVCFALRTFFPNEAMVIRIRMDGAQSVRQIKEWVIAHAIWMVDGQIIGSEHYNAPYEIRQLVQSWPSQVVDAAAAVVSDLTRRSDAALHTLEGYSYEPVSRGRWRMVSKGSPALQAPVWVAPLGPNMVQQLWVAYNIAEDDRLSWDQEWYAAKTIASTMDPKWIKKISDSEKTRWSAEEARRADVVRRARQGLPPNVPAEDEDVEGGHTALKIRTYEDMNEQVRRWKAGELDDHDRIVQEYKEQIRKRHDEMAQAHRDRMERTERVAGVAGQVAAYTPEQAAALGIDRPALRNRTVMEDPMAEDLYSRYIAPDTVIGQINPDGKVAVESPMPSEIPLGGRRVSIEE